MFKGMLSRLTHEEDAAAASEYAILVAVIVVAVYAAIKVFNLENIFGVVSNKVQGCISSTNTSC